jgi:hypothetical protein
MELVIIILVAAHLLAVNLAGAGPLVAAWIDWRGARRAEPEAATAAARTLLWWSIGAAVVGMVLGGGAIAQLIYRPPHTHRWYWWYAGREITVTRWWFLGGEIAFYYGCTLAAAVIWRRADRLVWVRRLLAIAAGTNLLYHFPALFTILAIMFERPDEKLGWPLDQELYRHFLLQAETIARILHVWLSSLAVAGLSLCWIGARSTPVDSAASRRVAVNGAWVSLGATLLQIPVGVWLLTALPDWRTQRILSSAPIFWPAIFAALALMHQLAMLSIGDLSRRRLSTATMLIVVVVILMTATLYSSRPL